MNEMLMEIGQGALVFLSSSLGTFGFAVFMHAPKRAWLLASTIGGAAYLLYWTLMQFGVYEPLSMFLGARLGALLGQYCARRMRMIATIFLLLGMIPLVPGLGLYRCMHYLAQEMYSEGLDAGVRAMVDIVMIAFGLGIGSYVFRLLTVRRKVPQEGVTK